MGEIGNKVKKNTFQTFALKALYVLARIKYPALRKDLRYFIRDNYYCRLFQSKFLLKDYVLKKNYKVISYQGEFDQELRYVLPFAYWHYLNGTLKKTISSKNTKEFYFFSSNHEEKFENRIWTESYNHYDVPNMTHSNSYSFKKWQKVPLKSYYQNNVFVYEKPILVIANKYNIEWDQPPVNFLDIPTLKHIFDMFNDKYQIIYNRPLATQIVADNSETLNLNEHNWIKENYQDVILMDDLYIKHKEILNNYNHLQLMVYANCNHFISMHGGTAALASYFGGINIILSDPKWGMENQLGEYATIFPALSDAKIHHAATRSNVLELLDVYY
jgi:hypothetical protein